MGGRGGGRGGGQNRQIHTCTQASDRLITKQIAHPTLRPWASCTLSPQAQRPRIAPVWSDSVRTHIHVSVDHTLMLESHEPDMSQSPYTSKELTAGQAINDTLQQRNASTHTRTHAHTCVLVPIEQSGFSEGAGLLARPCSPRLHACASCGPDESACDEQRASNTRTNAAAQAQGSVSRTHSLQRMVLEGLQYQVHTLGRARHHWVHLDDIAEQAAVHKREAHETEQGGAGPQVLAPLH